MNRAAAAGRHRRHTPPSRLGRWRRCRWLVEGTAVALAACGLFEGRQAAAEDPIRFSRDIQPILSDNCYACHGPDAAHRKADLRLDTPEGAYREADGTAVIRPGDSLASEFYRRLVTDDPDEIMPPPDSHRTLTPAQIDLLRRWIDSGAHWGEHWAFVRVERPPVPAPAFADVEAANPIDAFVHARLAREGLRPSPPADQVTLVRRLSLDLTGLPPSPEEVDAFLADAAPGAEDRLVDRLLESPHFGERMAWDWLEAARYADSNGYQGDSERTMWPWRDWVVDAFNRNLPYDEFTIWQLAGDRLPEPNREQILATGFCRNHMINGEGGRIAEENRVDYVMDMTETAGTIWLGLTLNCCRCHDHKFDPVTQREYYQLFAFFNQTPVDGGGGNPQTPPVIDVPTAAQETKQREIDDLLTEQRNALASLEAALPPAPTTTPETTRSTEGDGSEDGPSEPEAAKTPTVDAKAAVGQPDEIRAIHDTPIEKRSADQLVKLAEFWNEHAPDFAAAASRLQESLRRRDSVNGSIPRVMVMKDREEPRETFILDRGLYNSPGPPVTAGVPAKLPPLPPDAAPDRLALARWLFSRENPLTARVTVNRIWQQFFGIGLVKTAEDFGVQGEFPHHPELLDWLASEFMESGWDVKHLVRLITTSATYRQSSKVSPEVLERDPENRLLARGARFRMPSWMMRDQALAASGLLVGTIGGPPVHPYQPEGVWQEATFGLKKYPRDSGDNLYRRSLYTFWRRIIGPTLFFDVSNRQTCSVKMVRTNTPLHALATLNDTTYVEAARALAQACLQALPPDAAPEAAITLAHRRLLGRPPSGPELALYAEGFRRHAAAFGESAEDTAAFLAVGDSKRDESLPPDTHAALAAVCLTLLNLDETVTRE